MSLTNTIKFLLSLPLLTLSKPALSLWPLSQGQNLVEPASLETNESLLVKHPGLHWGTPFGWTQLEFFGGPGGPASLEMNESLL